MKVGIVIITYNLDSRIFLLQIEAIKRFCKDDFEINIFDNSFDKNYAKDIKYHSERLGLLYKRTKSGSKNSSDSHCFALKFAYEQLCNNYDYFIFMDHDVIPLSPFSFFEVLGTKLMAGVGQGLTKKYLWIGICFMNLSGIDKSLIDLNYSHEFGLDSGGNLYKVIEKYGEENFIFFDEVYCQLEGFNGKYGYYALINNNMFTHWVGGSNWEGIERHEERMNALLNITQELMNENVD